MIVKVLKTWPPYWDAVASGKKPFEIRKNDRDFRVGDFLLLRKWSPITKRYIRPRKCWLVRKVVYVTEPDCPFLPRGYVAMGLARATPRQTLLAKDMGITLVDRLKAAVARGRRP